MYYMENLYSFSISPETYQPSGCVDFSKIYNITKITASFCTHLNIKKTEHHNMVSTKNVDINEYIKNIYKFQHLMLENKK